MTAPDALALLVAACPVALFAHLLVCDLIDAWAGSKVRLECSNEG